MARLEQLGSPQHLSNHRVCIHERNLATKCAGEVVSDCGIGKPGSAEEKENYEYKNRHSFTATGFGSNSYGCGSARSGRDLGGFWTAGVTGVLSTTMSGTRLHLDTRLLGLWTGWLLLGAGNVGHGTATGISVDARMVGMGR